MTSISTTLPSGETIITMDRIAPQSPEDAYEDVREKAARDLKRAREILDTTREDWHAEDGTEWPERDEEIAKDIKRRTLNIGGGETILAHKPGEYVHPETGERYTLNGVLGWYSAPWGGSSGWPTFWRDLIPLAEWEAQQ